MLILLAYVVAGAAAGTLGALVGLGGGIIIVPVLSLFLGVPIHQAVAASLVAVVATSSVAAIGYVRDEITNLRLGMTLETATTAGAIGGGLLASHLQREVLSAVFAAFLVLNALYLILKQSRGERARADAPETGALGGRYHDAVLGREVSYRVHNVPLGMAVSALAGAISGLLGIGGGPIKVPMMTSAMGVPMKAAAATSNFMIGVTACASAALYYNRGLVSPAVAVPVALGVAAGAYAGSRLARRVHGAHLSRILAAVLSILAVQMSLAAAGIRLR
ncbi:MAG: sulfite exporter TauE/SafE family protein [Elusimicrobiota bacterium]|nr:sulfite exporter TauE/SafE family protein [Elusimicrobiota bacterium]